MPPRLLRCEGIVLGRNLSGEHHWRVDVLSPDEGPVRTLARRPSAKRFQSPPPDLFDRVTLELEQSARGKTLFIKEVHSESPFAAIGQNYTTLVEAAGFAGTLWKNLSHAEHFEELYDLAERSLAAFARILRPEVTHFKSLYLFARAEGYPVKEHMLAGWPADDRRLAQRLLAEPLEGDQPPVDEAKRLLERLQHYIAAYTDILI